MKTITKNILLIACALTLHNTAKAQFTVTSASYLGDAANDNQVRGSRIQSDGTIVLATNLGSARPSNLTPVLLNNATASTGGVVVRLSADGRTVLSVTRLADKVNDLALDRDNNIYVAAGAAGLFKLTPNAAAVTWNRLSGSYVHRVDAAADGTSAALVPSSISEADNAAGRGRVTLFDASGTELTNFLGHNNTHDVAVDGASRTVNVIGWRQATAFDGSRNEPVQIAYLRGYGYDGTVKWTDYDWSTDRNSPNFINKPENNMADTRGYRCSIGRDGKLYAAFECAGGNHIFRYSPTDISTKASIVGGDKYHNFSNTKSEHKTFFARYEPGTGAYLKGQQLVNRLNSGAGNTIRVQGGEISADETGQVYIGGGSAAGLPPLTLDPPGLGSYSGGAWFMVMNPDFNQRLFVTRLNAGGLTSAVDARTINGRVNITWAGQSKLEDGQYLLNAVQPTAGGGTYDGFFAVIGSAATTVTNTASGREASATLQLYPNPTRREFAIGYDAQQRGPVRVEIEDTLGRPAVAAFERQAQAGANSFAVSLPELPQGMYLVRVRQGGTTFTQKLVLAD